MARRTMVTFAMSAEGHLTTKDAVDDLVLDDNDVARKGQQRQSRADGPMRNDARLVVRENGTSPLALTMMDSTT